MLPDGSEILGQNKFRCRSLHLLTACVMTFCVWILPSVHVGQTGLGLPGS